ncbi:MAG: hypothetical protein QOE86_2202 [Solirubrobacteraceae bacterium]|jgi:hypothetical protein|nr:hypothetical protein [Solirubrobacteraceae bacterium]
MDGYPVTYEADYVEERSRLHTFFRLLTIIPAAIVLWVFSLGLIVTLPVAWIVMVVTGEYLPGLYRYHAGMLRAGTRLGGYALLVTDRYPPLDLGEDPEYPVRVAIGAPQERYSRLLAAVRLILYIPIYIVSYLLLIVAEVVAIASWFVIVVTGRQLPALQAAINMGSAYHTRSLAYLMLLTEQWPPLGDIDMELEPRAPAGGPLSGPTEKDTLTV